MTTMTAETDPRRVSWTAAQLMDITFPEPRWAVPGLLAEGLTLLAGAPKLGKSWLALNLGVAIATGGIALGKIPVTEGDVLYLALEDTPRRLQSRLTKVLAGDAAPDRLTLTVACETIPNGGSERIASWLDTHPDARLVIIDVFAKVRGVTSSTMNAYDADYGAMGRLKDLADRYKVPFLVVHHTRKMAATDYVDTVSGTHGLSGNADGVMVLTRARGKAAAELHVTSRDVTEAEYALDFKPEIGSWLLLDGPATDYELGDTRKAILDHLRRVPADTPLGIAKALDASHDNIKKTCQRMFNTDQLDTDGQGNYFLPHVPVPPVSPVPDDAGPGDSRDSGDTPTWGLPEVDHQ